MIYRDTDPRVLVSLRAPDVIIKRAARRRAFARAACEALKISLAVSALIVFATLAMIAYFNAGGR